MNCPFCFDRIVNEVKLPCGHLYYNTWFTSQINEGKIELKCEVCDAPAQLDFLLTFLSSKVFEI